MSYFNLQTGTKHIRQRFDGFLPVVVDLETSGCIAATDGILEIAVVTLRFNDQGYLQPDTVFACNVEPFPGARIDRRSIEVNGINVAQPFRFALSEEFALKQLFDFVRQTVRYQGCRKALLVGHNAHFDLNFIIAASERWQLRKRNPFHSFTCLDTATLSGLNYGITVLARAAKAAGIRFDHRQAHSAVYDVQVTAKLFCQIVNHFDLQNWGGMLPPKF